MGSLLPAFRCTLKASVLWWVSARLRCAELAGGSQGWGREGRRTRAQGGVPLWVCVYVCTCHGWLWINLYMWVCKCDACMSLHSLLICVNALGTGIQVFRYSGIMSRYSGALPPLYTQLYSSLRACPHPPHPWSLFWPSSSHCPLPAPSLLTPQPWPADIHYQHCSSCSGSGLELGHPCSLGARLTPVKLPQSPA